MTSLGHRDRSRQADRVAEGPAERARVAGPGGEGDAHQEPGCERGPAFARRELGVLPDEMDPVEDLPDPEDISAAAAVHGREMEIAGGGDDGQPVGPADAVAEIEVLEVAVSRVPFVEPMAAEDLPPP